MHEAELAGLVYKGKGRQAAAFYQLEFLAVETLGNDMVGIGNADKRHFVIMPPPGESCGILRTDGNYFSIALNKFLVVLAQLRHMLPAMRSKEAAVKDQKDILFPSV